jgi:hypothetical protein
MLAHETVDADGVLTRTPLGFAYASAWAKILNYPLQVMSDQRVIYHRPDHGKYYLTEIVADHTSVRVSASLWRFTLYFQTEPLKGGVSAHVGMFGEPIPEDLFQQMMLSVRELPYSAIGIDALIEKSDFLDLNPMYRGLPGVAARKSETPGQSATEATRPRDWS